MIALLSCPLLTIRPTGPNVKTVRSFMASCPKEALNLSVLRVASAATIVELVCCLIPLPVFTVKNPYRTDMVCFAVP